MGRAGGERGTISAGWTPASPGSAIRGAQSLATIGLTGAFRPGPILAVRPFRALPAPTRPMTFSQRVAAAALIGVVFLGLGPVAAASAKAAPEFPCAATAWAGPQDDQRKAEFKERFDASKEDRTALWELHQWCTAFGMDREAEKVLRGILRVDDGDRKARELLGHIEYDGQWFTDEKKLAKYKADKEEAEAREKGWVRFRDAWVAPADIPFLEKGMVRDADGTWISKEDFERRETAGCAKTSPGSPPKSSPTSKRGSGRSATVGSRPPRRTCTMPKWVNGGASPAPLSSCGRRCPAPRPKRPWK